MKKITLCVILFHLFIIPLARADWFPGENLLTPFIPSTDEWEALEKKEDGFYARLWQRKGAGFSDSYSVSVIRGREDKLYEFRKIQDAPGKKGCETFESEILNESPTNGYSRLMWRTRCGGKGGFVASTLQVAIQGHDSLYHVSKIWRADVSAQEMALWRERLSSISVCDTREPKSPCPEGFQRVQ
jgi:hypothetical protein